ncbi:MAG: hypothetical protein P9M15_02790 [Candidatus Electryoneaceae bacterium]|nr:hypothetical protein [Candidatus Electryoneaceae bacterium]
MRIAIMLVSILILAGCTHWADENDLAELEAAEKAVVSAERQLNTVETEKRGIERELQALEDSLREVQTELDSVRSRSMRLTEDR